MEEFSGRFLNPPNSYRPQPFWFLNHRLTEDRLRWQIREMAEKGVGGAILHARHGLLTPYMSAEWLAAIGVCVDELARHGMEAWLYDENNWPSGTFGGQLTREHPEFRMRYLRVQTLRVAGGATYQATLDADDNALLCAQAIRLAEDDELAFVGEVRDISERCREGRLRWEAPTGNWLVALFWECPVAAKVTFANGYYLDTMNEQAVEAFRSLAYAPYDVFSDEFGQTIKGVFTDEPGLMVHDAFFKLQAMRSTVEDPQRLLPGLVLAWTRDFEQRFRDLCGYDLRPRLLGLIYDLGPDTTQLREDYFRAISLWYSQAYHGKLSLWCRERDLQYIGHTLEEPLFNQVRTQGNQTWVLSAMDRPGLDYLGHGVGTKQNPNRILSVKCAASVAHTQGKPRVMCEAFGGSGHGHTLLDRRLDANFMACLGVNMIIPHAFYYSFEGYRKTDWPPTEFYHQPYWIMYKDFADYLGRLCLVQSEGHHVATAAILTPVKTMYADMYRQGEAVTEPPCQELHTRLSETMLALHWDYDYLDDSQLPAAIVETGRLGFTASQESYPLVILPGARVMSVAAALKLKEFFDSGGRVISLGELPAEADERGKDEELREIVGAIFGQPDARGNCRHENEAGGLAVAANPREVEDWLKRHLPDLVSADVTITDDRGQPAQNIICCHRHSELDTYLLVNRTKEVQVGNFASHLQGRVEEWSLETGERWPIAATQTDDGGVQVMLEFEPAEARLLVIDPRAPFEAIAELPQPTVLARIDLQPEWEFQAPAGNVAIIDRWLLTARDVTAGQRLRAPEKVNSYQASFEVEGIPGNLRLVLDDLKQWLPSHVGFLSGIRSLEIFVNGQQAPPLQPSAWQDPDYLWADITPLLREGANDLQIDTVSLLNPMHGLREPVYLVGDFIISEGKLKPPSGKLRGFYTEHGYPHYAGLGRYRQTVTIPERFEGQRLILDPGRVEGCLRVIVNGQTVGTRIWPPYEMDIAPAVRPGRNEIILEVAGTLANLYSKERRPFGLGGPVAIWVMS